MTLSRKIIQIMVLVVALGATVVLVLGILKGTARKDQQKELVSEAPEAEMKLTDMEYTEMQGGRRLWTLKASEAEYFQDAQKTRLKAVHLTFFFENGDVAYLESKEGALYAGTKDIELWDSIKASLPKGYEFTADRAFYEHQQEVIRSDDPIRVKGEEIQMDGSRWEYKIQEQKAVVEGGVRATFMFLPEEDDAGE